MFEKKVLMPIDSYHVLCRYALKTYRYFFSKKLLMISFACIYSIYIFSKPESNENVKQITLLQAIQVATDSSLTSFKAKNLYLLGYWQYRTFKAERLPSMSLGMTPFSYNKNFVKRYDSQTNVDVYKSQQSLYSYANLSIRQNLDFTGGTFFIDTELGYLRNLGSTNTEQYTSIPFRIGYSQALFGYNAFKWEKKIEPIKYEKAKKEFLYNMEEISEQTTQYFFNLALSQTVFDLSKQNIANNDTLYQIGQERYKIGSMSYPDLLTLKLQLLNAKNELGDAEIDLKNNTFSLASFLRYDSQTQFQLTLPEQLLGIFINPNEAISLAKENNPTATELTENLLTAQQALDKTKKESRFSASFSASVGFNQVSNTFIEAYQKPLQQDMVAVSLNVPIVDWGIRKGKVKIAQRNLNTMSLTAKQTEQSFSQEVLMAVNEFNLRQSQIESAKEVKDIASQAFDKTKQLFIIGKIDVNDVNMAISRQIEAERKYINAVKNYWLSYFKIRKLTLYDFVTKKPINIGFEDIEII